MDEKELSSGKEENLENLTEDEIEEIGKVLTRLKKYCDGKPECEDCIFTDENNEVCYLTVPSFWNPQKFLDFWETEDSSAEDENN